MQRDEIEPLEELAAHIIDLQPDPHSSVEICIKALTERENLMEAFLQRPIQSMHDLELLLRILENELEHEGLDQTAVAHELVNAALRFVQRVQA